jgi:hypothetical protein
LKDDRSETKNLASEIPGKVKELEDLWIRHAKDFEALGQQDPPPPATVVKP